MQFINLIVEMPFTSITKGYLLVTQIPMKGMQKMQFVTTWKT